MPFQTVKLSLPALSIVLAVFQSIFPIFQSVSPTIIKLNVLILSILLKALDMKILIKQNIEKIKYFTIKSVLDLLQESLL